MAPSLRSAGKGLEQLTGQVGMSHRYVIDIDRSLYQLGLLVQGVGSRRQLAEAHLPGRGARRTRRSCRATSATRTSASSRAAGADSGRVQEWLVTVTRARQPLSGAIYLVDFLGMPVVTWRLNEFFPIGWRLSEFDSGGSRPAIETLELTHTGFLDAEARCRVMTIPGLPSAGGLAPAVGERLGGRQAGAVAPSPYGMTMWFNVSVPRLDGAGRGSLGTWSGCSRTRRAS